MELQGLDVRRGVVVPARDGVALSVNLFLPLAGEPFPVVLGMDPYRKDDWSAAWDLTLAAYLAERGYAYCRLDVRGTGSSGGVALDEYTDAETTDGYDTVEWLAAQPWCTGAVGMWGISYGGFTALQVAALAPPHLRAIVPIQATDNRYTDDIHYVGGAMTVSELGQYAVSQVAMNALPPAAPDAVYDAGLRDRWRARLEATPVWLIGQARQQRDGPYWRRGSVAPDYGRITAAMLGIGGWMDGYVDATLRLQARCVQAPRRAIVGPWVHGLPDSAYPGPNTDWLHEMVRWFDRWLCDVPNGADEEPALTWFHRDPTTPARYPAQLNGAWRAVRRYDDCGAALMVLALDGGEVPGRGRLVAAGAGASAGQPTASGPGIDRFAHVPSAGAKAGSLCWGAGHPPNGLADDLRAEDENGPIWTSEPLQAPIDILGRPVAVFHLSASQPVAHLVVRLASVAPDGATEQVCEGILNLTHRDSHVDPAPLEPGRVYEVRVELRSAGYRFPAGYRIRLTAASSHWPVIWPSPGLAVFAIHRGPSTPSRLELPLAPVLDAPDAAPPPALRSEPPALREFGSETSSPLEWSNQPEGPEATVRTFEGATSTLPDGRSTLYVDEGLTMTASNVVPGTGVFTNTCEYRLKADGGLVSVVASGRTEATADAFLMDVELAVTLDGEPFFTRRWDERILRDLL